MNPNIHDHVAQWAELYLFAVTRVGDAIMPVETDQAPYGGAQLSRTKKKKTARNVLLGVVAFFLVVAVGAGVYAFNLANSFNSKSQKIEQAFPAESARPAETKTDAVTCCCSAATAARQLSATRKPAVPRTSAQTP